MGNQMCKDAIYNQDFKDEKVFRFIQNSVHSGNQFPQDKIPEIAFEKLKSFQIYIPMIKSGSLREYSGDDNYRAYLVHSIDKINNANVQFDLKSDEKVILCIFHRENPFHLEIQSLNNNQQEIQKNDYLHKKSQSANNNTNTQYKFEKLYYGKINKKMQASDGVLINFNGESYQGSMKNLKFQGDNGILKNYHDNHYYQGPWVNGKPNGEGLEVMKEVYEYQGQFQEGKWQKQGKLKLFTNQGFYQYQGQFVDGKLTGIGKIIHNDKIIYEGEFMNSQQHGKGKWTGANGQYYEGEFISGKKEGFGVYYFNLNKRYEGEFKDGKPNGEGVLYNNHKQSKGYWSNGKNVVIFQSKQVHKQNLE